MILLPRDTVPLDGQINELLDGGVERVALGLGRGHLVSSIAMPIESGGGGGGVTGRERRRRCGRARGARTMAWAQTSAVLLLLGNPSAANRGLTSAGEDDGAGANGELDGASATSGFAAGREAWASVGVSVSEWKAAWERRWWCGHACDGA